MWKKAEDDVIMGGRFRKENNGNLHILDVRMQDAGRYHCVAGNEFGRVTASGLLLVRRKTTITVSPTSQVVAVGRDVTLRCDATTDQLEYHNLRISWLFNGEKIEFGSRTNVAQNDDDVSLKITRAQVDNSGNYTCNASTALDWDDVTATLTVTGRPDHPYDVHLTSCGVLRADVAWSPGSDNNDPVVEYIIYHNTSFDETGQFTEAARVSARRHSAAVRLQPWTNYTFSVRARNSLGLGERSAFTPYICTTPQSRPYRNPSNVCSVSRAAHQLVIVWEPIQKSDQNGEGFYYIVSYKRRDVSNAREHRVNVPGWHQSELVIENQETFREYEIAVRSANSQGLTPSRTLGRKIAYSGQGVPQDRPQNLELVQSTLTSTSAEFTWDAVDDSAERVQGFLLGYQLVFWRNGDPSTNRSEYIISRDWYPCRSLQSSPSRRSWSHSQRGHTNRLWPNSRITAGVMALNGAHAGSLSDAIEFSTPEARRD